MTPLSFSLDCSDEFPPSVSQDSGQEAQPLVRKSKQQLSALSDVALQEYEDECFGRIRDASGDERDALIHSVADALVERGSRGAKQ